MHALNNRMRLSMFRNAMLAALGAALISICQSQSYIDLEALGVNCPARDKCRGYNNSLTYIDRSCECDDSCTAYKDCCIDALPNQATEGSRPPARTDVMCLHYGEKELSGVYVINNCSSNWRGPRQVKEKCLGDDDFSDPLVAAPTTDVLQKKTYRNLACAKCNNANLASLKTFGMRLQCYGLEKLPQEQIMDDLTYNQETGFWGVNRLNRFGNATEFVGCNIIYDVQEYLNSSVRFCRPNLVSTCATNWARPQVARLCSQYMAVVYSNKDTYKNPHCALCNRENMNEVSCIKLDLGRRPGGFSFTHLMDVNQSDGGEVGMHEVTTPEITTPECPSGRKYDPFFKRCRLLVCPIPGQNLIEGRCQAG